MSVGTGNRALVRLLAIAGLACVAAGAAAAPQVFLDGRPLRFSLAQPYQDRSVWMLPALPLLRAAGASYEWDWRAQRLTVSVWYGEYEAVVGSYTVIRNKTWREILSRPVALRLGEPFVPVDLVEMWFRCKAVYDRERDVIYLDTDRGWGGRPLWGAGSPWRQDWRDRDRERERRERDIRNTPLTLELPARTWNRNVRIGGTWGGSEVRVTIYKENGERALLRTTRPRDSRWEIAVVLSGGRYRVVAEGFGGSFVPARREAFVEIR